MSPAHLSRATQLSLLFATLLFGCRSALPESVRSDPAPPVSSFQAAPAGSAVVVRRPTPGVALLSLWLDAGARDATPPQLATVTAWWVAQQIGAQARVLMDGTELRLLCDTRTEAVGICAERLLRALATTKAPSEAQVAALRVRLRETRGAAGAAEARRAQQLAVSVLLGGAQGSEPFGDAEDDDKVKASDVRQFAATRYALERALLIGAGDLDKPDLDRALAKVRPASTATARPTGHNAKLSEGVLVELGSSNELALAIPVASGEAAGSLASEFRRTHPYARAAVSAMPGAFVVHLSMPGGDALYARLQAAVFDVLRILSEGSTRTAPASDTLEGLTSWLGETWVARAASARVEVKLAVGLVLRRDGRVAEDEAATREKALQKANAAIANGRANSVGEVRGEVRDTSASVSTTSGAQIQAIRRPRDPWFAAAIRFAGGAQTDAPLSHGRAALLAGLMADGCGFSSERELDARLTEMGAQLRPLVTPDGLGVSIRAPMEHSEQALDTMLRCAVRPSFSSRAVEDARARLLNSLRSRQQRLLEAALARALSPAAPGRIAPWGAVEGVANVEASELRRLHAQHALASRTKVWVVADREPERIARFVARRLAHLPSNAARDAQTEWAREHIVDGTFVAGEQLRAVVGVGTKAGSGSHHAAFVVGELLARGLSKRVGKGAVPVSSSSQQLAAAGAAVTLAEEELDVLPMHTNAVFAELAALPDTALLAALRAAEVRDDAQLSSALGFVEASFFFGASANGAARDELATMRRLIAEKPNFYVLRPHP